MKLILIGTDHKLQHSNIQDAETKAWVPRKAQNFRRLIVHCIERLGAKVILEEVHPEQELFAPTICSTIASARALPWYPLGMGEPGLADVLIDPPIVEALRLNIKPDFLAGRYILGTHEKRECHMFDTIVKCLEEHECGLAVVGYVHLGVLARMFEVRRIPVEALMFTHPLVVDEDKA